MKRFKKMISILLMTAVLLSSAAFCASAETGSVDVVYSVLGSGEIEDGDLSTYEGMTRTYAKGTQVTVTATPDSGSEFLYWVNKENKRVVSFETEYTYYAATYAEVEAVFDEAESSLTAGGQHRVVYMTEGYNILYSEIINIGDDTYPVPEDKLYVGGKTWIGWDHTPAQVAAENGRIYVYPAYSKDVSYVITTEIGNTRNTQQAGYGATASVDAPETLNGDSFSYWIVPKDATDPYDEDEIVSYTANYSFIVTMDITLVAVYGASDGSGIATRVAGDVPKFSDSNITFYIEHSVTEDYTVLQHGMVMTLDLAIGNDASRFVINPNESKILKGTSNNTARVGTYVVTKTKWASTMVSGGETVNYYPLVFVRSYIIVQDTSGNIQTVYSPIYVADYVNVTFTGVLEGSNYDDPFAA